MGNQGRVGGGGVLSSAVLIKTCMLKGVNQSSCVSTPHQPVPGAGGLLGSLRASEQQAASLRSVQEPRRRTRPPPGKSEMQPAGDLKSLCTCTFLNGFSLR